MLLTVVREKLPREIKLNIARTKDTPGWSLSQLMSALLKEIRMLEYGAHNSLMGSSQSTAAFVVGSNPTVTGSKISCIFCKGPHATHLCTVIMDRQRRLEIVKQNHLCFNCLDTRCLSVRQSSNVGVVNVNTTQACVMENRVIPVHQ